VNALPELVRRYVESALPDLTHTVKKVELTQIGEMVLKPGKRPLRFDAVEEFATDAIAFTWRARFGILGPLSIRVTDSYRPPDGLLEVRALGLPLRRTRGPELPQGEALRYLAEIPWVPHAIIANTDLRWRAIDDRTVEVSAQVADDRVAVALTFDRDEIIRTVADRPRLEDDGTVTRWVGEFGDYRSFGAIRMPASGEVSWELPEGPFTYWRGTITSVETRD
jgi:uncharacterized protein DUF6544